MPAGRLKRNLEEVYRLSGARADKKDAKDPDGLVPVFIGFIRGDGTEVREELLWRNGENEMTHTQAATRFCSELNLVQHYERLVAEQIATQVLSQQDLVGEKLVRLDVYVRNGEWVFRESMEWDMNNPYNLPHQYASQACEELGLDINWFSLIDKEVLNMIKYSREEILLCMEQLSCGERIPSLKRIRRSEPELDAYRGPRLERYDPMTDPTSRREEIRKQVAKRYEEQSAKASSIKKEEPVKEEENLGVKMVVKKEEIQC
ncbi:hypothetical protein BSKO_14057 [Bryopsis sp. KO-2023]|nr:hypothetical protein BSKO_14057 [Bryopsis sp. KO-2023]